MTVRTRLVVFGAVLPTVALLVAVLVAGRLFRRDQLAAFDRRLLAQAAAESSGLFDGPNGTPHVHVPRSPIADAVREFAPVAAIYDAAGTLILAPPDPALVPATVPLTGAVAEVRIVERSIAGIERRVLELPVRAPDGRVYTLWLGGSLDLLEATMVRFYQATFTAVALLGLALLGLQLVIARRLAARIDQMIAFLPHLRDGSSRLPPDPIRDELGSLRETLGAVATRLAEARREQDRLLASAAHELRTPLTVIRTEIDLALRRERPTDELRATLRTVRDEVVRLAGLAGALLDLQAVRHLGFAHEDGDLVALVREACGALATVADAHGIELRIEGDATAPARFDERALRQVLDNLLGNALKHAPRGTAVEIAVTRVGDRWQVAVADRGPGIPADEAERVFEPFHRLGEAGAGTGAGLGLAIVREVAQRHGGRVWVDSGYTVGARVILELG